MRARALAIIITGVVVAAGGFALMRHFSPDDVALADDTSRPTLLNEVREWCVSENHPTNCERAVYESLPDGSLRVVLNYNQDGYLADICALLSVLNIPPGVNGWAFVEVPGTYLGVGTPAPFGQQAGQTFDEWLGQFTLEEHRVMTFPELIPLRTPEPGVYRHGDLRVCELIVQPR